MDINKTNEKFFISDYWTNRSKNYDSFTGHMYHCEIEEKFWIQFLKNVIGKEQKLILDVGCGTGFLSILLTELGHNVIGIDFSKGMLDAAKKNSIGLKIPFLFGDAEKTQFLDNTFDIVINRHLLWTLPNPKKAIKHWKNLLVKNGELIIIDAKWDFSKSQIYDKRIIEKLPFYGNQNRPDMDIEYLIESGFNKDFILSYDLQKLFESGSEFLEIKDYFMIKAFNK